jgi:Tfp pilus assembly protein PilX
MLMNPQHRNQQRGEGGFALVVVIGVMAVVMLFSVGAFAAVNGDLPGSSSDITRKQAFDAADVGVADYLAMLNADSAAWTKCTTAGPALNNPWTGRKAPAGTRWRNVPGETSQYSIELLPARKSGFDTCSTDPNSVAKSMIDPISHGLRIRVTGRATGAKGLEQRSVIATFRRASFLDYLYFTDYESSDPVWMVNTTNLRATKPTTAADGDLVTWAQNNCVRYYRPAPAGAGTAGYNRPGYSWKGRIDTNGDGTFAESAVSVNCDGALAIQFASFDKLLGPIHTNDEFLMCDKFTAGRQDHPDDRIESGRSWRPCDGKATTQPNFQGTLVQNAPTLKLPPTDATLSSIALPAYTFSGRTRIAMKANGKLDITSNGVTQSDVSPPSNGVIYVKNGTVGSCGPYQPLNPYQQGSGTAPTYTNTAAWGISTACGDALVSGTYTKDLTIAAANDVIVTNDVISSDGDAHLGLIADNFVRVQHLVTRTDGANPKTCSEPTDGSRISGRRIDAAILSLLHSFMVDNYYCGGGIGTLTVNGVIAQKFRGAVGTNNGATGFAKNYTYEESLAYKGPPHFLDPVQAAWKLRGYTEQQGSHTPNP